MFKTQAYARFLENPPRQGPKKSMCRGKPGHIVTIVLRTSTYFVQLYAVICDCFISFFVISQ